MDAPEWLTKREGTLRQGLNEETLYVVLDGQPRYKLFATTAAGEYTCAVTQTVNGKRLDAGKTYADLNEALRGGLGELQESLGWCPSAAECGSRWPGCCSSRSPASPSVCPLFCVPSRRPVVAARPRTSASPTVAPPPSARARRLSRAARPKFAKGATNSGPVRSAAKPSRRPRPSRPLAAVSGSLARRAGAITALPRPSGWTRASRHA